MIKSFEEAQNGPFGDLLSKKSQAKEPKIGLFTGGYFEYWRMYPQTLEKKIEDDMTKIYNCLKKYFGCVVWPGVVDTLDKADEAGRLFSHENVDMVIYVAGTYCPDYMSIQALSYVRDAKLILFNTQADKNVDRNGDYEETLRSSGLISITQLSGALKKMGWFKQIKVVVGTHEEDQVYQEIEKYANAYKTYTYLKNLNIGLVGHVFRGMYDFEYDKTRLKGILGPNVINIQLSHLLNEYENSIDDEVESIIDAVGKRFDIVGLDHDDLTRSTRLYYALKSLFDKYNLDAVCLLGQHYIEQKTGATSYLANMMFHEEKDRMIVTEGDVHGLIVMCMMNILSKQTPLFAEWGEYDEKDNAILFMHHGFADPDNAKCIEDIKINRSPEQWGLQGNGFNMQFTAKPGIVTIAHLIADADGYKMIIMKGDALDIPSIPCEEVTAFVKIEKPVKDFIKELLYEGFSHHAIIGYGDMTEELGYIADFMGIRKIRF